MSKEIKSETKTETKNQTKTETKTVDVEIKEAEPTYFYTVPKPLGVTSDYMTVTINGVNTMIKYNTPVMLSQSVIDVIKHSQKLDDEIQLYSNNRR